MGIMIILDLVASSFQSTAVVQDKQIVLHRICRVFNVALTKTQIFKNLRMTRFFVFVVLKTKCV